MGGLVAGLLTPVIVAVVVLSLTFHIVELHERGVLFRFGRVIGEKLLG